jgi:hypothetical protein
VSASDVDALRERWAPWVAGLIVFLVALVNVTPHVIGVFFDDAIYALLGKALATGEGLVYTQLPGTPPAIHYPPLFPLVLAAVWKVAPPFPDSVMWLKLVNPVLLGASASVGVVVARHVLQLPLVAAVGTVLLGFVSIPAIMLGSVLLSEPLFFLTFFVAVWAAARLVEGGGMRWAVIAGVAVAAVILTRTIGGVLLPAVLLTLAWERRWRDAALFAGATILCIAPWQYFVWVNSPGFPDELRGSYGPYLEWVIDGYRAGGSGLVRAVLEKNLSGAVSFLGIFFSPLVRVIRPVIVIALLALFLCGIVLGMRSRPTRVLGLALGGYVAVILFWPYQVERFLWGAWPALILLVMMGAHRAFLLLQERGKSQAAWSTVVVALVLAMGHATYNVRGLSKGWAGSASASVDAQMKPFLGFVLDNPDLSGRLIASDHAPAIALYTGGRAISLGILRVTDHVRDKSLEERVEEMQALDARFLPDAYVLRSNGVLLPAFLQLPVDSSRRFREVLPQGPGARAFLLDQ